MNIVTKVTGDSLTANEFNQIPDELENVITSAGLSPDDQTLNQVGKSIAQYVNDGNFYATSGSANAITLSNTQRLSPSALTNGLKVRFIASYNNTGTTTINVANLGAKNLKFKNKDLNADTIIADKYYEATYNSALGCFELDLESVLDTVKIYDTVSDLKNDANAEAGTICITKGYYSANDGGDGKYLIRTMTGSDVDDGGHILTISGGTLVAELITVNGIINIKQFGAYGDDTNDDTTAIQNAINCASTNNYQLYFQEGIYKNTNKLTLYANSSLIGVDVTIFDFSAMSLNDYYIHHLNSSLCDNNQMAFSQKGKPSINNIQFYGRGKNSSYPVLTTTWNTGTLLFIETSSVSYENVSIIGFNKGVTFGDNAYNITFINSIIRANNTGIEFDLTGHTNSGERIGFINSTICNNILGIYNKYGYIHISHCSLDYNKSHLYTENKSNGTVNSFVSIVNSHIEDTVSSVGSDIKFSLVGGIVNVVGCSFAGGHLEYFSLDTPSRLTFIGNKVSAGIHLFTEGSPLTYYIKTSNNNVSAYGNFCLANNNCIPFSTFYNLISTDFNEYTNAGVDYGSISETDGVLLLTGVQYHQPVSVPNEYIPIPEGANGVVSYFDIKVDNVASPMGNTLYPVSLVQYNQAKVQIKSTTLQSVQPDQVGSWINLKSAQAIIDKNAKFIRIIIRGCGGAGLDNTGAQTYIKNMYLGFN